MNINGKTIRIAQTNNSYIFPGLALGILASKARRVSDAMIMVSAKMLASLSRTRKNRDADLLPPLEDSRELSLLIAEAVGRQAIAEGLAGVPADAFEDELRAYVWEPVYWPYEKVEG